MMSKGVTSNADSTRVVLRAPRGGGGAMRRLDEEASALEPSATDAMTALAQNLRKITGVEGAVNKGVMVLF